MMTAPSRKFDALAALRGERERELTSAAERKEGALQAIEREDWKELINLGYGDFFERLAQSYPPARGGRARSVAPAEMRAFVRMLWRYEPAAWVKALELWQQGAEGDYRPYAAQLKAVLDQARRGLAGGERYGPDVAASHTRPDATAEAYAAVLVAAQVEAPCGCDRAVNLTIDAAGVLRCATCRGLDVGQLETAQAEQGDA